MPDSEDDPLPALREDSESSKTEAEALEKGPPSQLACDIGSPTSLPNPQSLVASPHDVHYDLVVTGSHCELPNGAAPMGSPRSYSAALLGEAFNPSPPTAVVDPVRQPEGDQVGAGMYSMQVLTRLRAFAHMQHPFQSPTRNA